MQIGLLLTALGGGGVEKRFLNLAAALKKRGHVVHLLVMFEGGPLVGCVPDDIRTVTLGGSNIWRKVAPLAKYLRKSQPDVVLSAKVYVNLVSLMARELARSSTRVVVSEIDSKSFLFRNTNRTKPKHVVRDHITRLLYRRADAIVGNSIGVVERIRNVDGLHRENIHLVYNGVDVSGISAMIDRDGGDPHLHGKDHVPVIIGSGRLVKQKDFETLIYAFNCVRQQRPAKLIILGEGPERPSLERLVDELGLRGSVRLPGFVNNPFAYMARAAVFVLSSRHEGFPNVLLEALACGRPVISTDCPAGPREILDDGRYGPLVPVGDSDALAEGILTTLDNPLPREVLMARAEVFSIDAMVDGYLRVFEG